jgi:hypothetical protein
MSPLRTLRTSRSLTFLDLARLADIPARTLAEAEYGLGTLSWGEWERLALVLGVGSADIAPPRRPQARALALPGSLAAGAPTLAALALATTLATATLQGQLPQMRLPAMPIPQLSLDAPTADAANALGPLRLSPAAPLSLSATQANLAAIAERAAAPREPIAPALLLAPTPAQPAPATPQFQLTAAGPSGCPVRPSAGHVVITQGYGVGSHAPTDVWGAVDLAVDTDGDGYAEPGSSWYAPVVATHTGTVRVDLDTYPAGNHVWVSDEASGWRTGYSHLAIITVISGQHVRAGEVIGMVGSSGTSSGPHLDYQVWKGEVNVDPTGLVGC